MSKEAPSGGEDTGFSQAEGLSELDAAEAIGDADKKGGYFDRENFLDRKLGDDKEDEEKPAEIAGGSISVKEKRAAHMKPEAKEEPASKPEADPEHEEKPEDVSEPETGPDYEHNTSKAFEMAHAEKAHREMGLAAEKVGQVERARELVEKAKERGETAGVGYEKRAEELKQAGVADADKITDMAANLYQKGESFSHALELDSVKDADELKSYRESFLRSVGAGKEVYSRVNALGGHDVIRETTHDHTKVVYAERYDSQGRLIVAEVIGMNKAMESRGGVVRRAWSTFRGALRGERFNGSRTRPSQELLSRIDQIGTRPSSSGGEGPPLRKKRPEDEE